MKNIKKKNKFFLFFREIYCNPEMSEKSRNELLFIMLLLRHVKKNDIMILLLSYIIKLIINNTNKLS